MLVLLTLAAADALVFLHIPETAGSTIETLSIDWKKRCGQGEHGVVWKRSCDWHTPPCARRTPTTSRCSATMPAIMPRTRRGRSGSAGTWPTPASSAPTT